MGLRAGFFGVGDTLVEGWDPDYRARARGIGPALRRARCTTPSRTRSTTPMTTTSHGAKTPSRISSVGYVARASRWTKSISIPSVRSAACRSTPRRGSPTVQVRAALVQDEGAQRGPRDEHVVAWRRRGPRGLATLRVRGSYRRGRELAQRRLAQAPSGDVRAGPGARGRAAKGSGDCRRPARCGPGRREAARSARGASADSRQASQLGTPRSCRTPSSEAWPSCPRSSDLGARACSW